MGKTYFTKMVIAKKLEVQPWLNVYHLDTKHRGDFSERDGRVYVGSPPPAFTDGYHKVVWQPYEDSITAYSKFFLNILNAGQPAIVNIDECVNMRFGASDNIPRGLKILYVQGRLPGIHVIAGTQEHARAPRQAHSQAWNVATFNLTNPYDETSMLNAMRLKERGIKKLNLKKMQFYFIRPDVDDVGVLYNTAQEFIPKVI
jgi:hypothetical protein